MAFDMEILAKNLKKYRAAKGITQQSLAEQLCVSAQSVSKWECAQSVPELDKLCAAADILNVSLEDLLDYRPADSRVLIGVDGGGSKTEFVLFRESGVLVKHIVLEGANPNFRGVEGSLAVFREGLSILLEPGMVLAGLFIGCAGFLSGGYGQKVKEALQKQYPKCKIECHSDVMNIIACGSDSYRCIAAICGTGSVVYANENRSISRLGGGGYLLDKQGSGFDIGRDVLRTALWEQDGVGEKSLITPLVEKQLGCTVWDGVSRIYREGAAFIATFAPIAFEAYAQGDKAAEMILREHAGYLAYMIQKAAKMYDCGNTVVLSGSIFKNSAAFLQMLKEQLTVPLQIEVPSQPPVYGACVLACELCGIDSAPFAKYFEEQYAELK